MIQSTENYSVDNPGISLISCIGSNLFGTSAVDPNFGDAYICRHDLDPVNAEAFQWIPTSFTTIVKTGTPGIGKTFSRNHDFRCILLNFEENPLVQQTAVVFSSSLIHCTYLVKLTKQVEPKEFQFEVEVFLNVHDCNIAVMTLPYLKHPGFRLYNLMDVSNAVSPVFCFGIRYYKTLKYSTPNSNAWKGEQQRTAIRYLPRWTFEEVTAAYKLLRTHYTSCPDNAPIPLNLDTAELERRFLDFQGVLRSVFAVDYDLQCENLITAVCDLDIQEAETNIHENILNNTKDVVHRVQHINVPSDLSTGRPVYNCRTSAATLVWGSKFIVSIVAERKRKYIESALNKAEFFPHPAIGYVYEALALAIIKTPNSCTLTNFGNANRDKVERIWKDNENDLVENNPALVTFPSDIFHTRLLNAPAGIYRPDVFNYPFIDACIVRISQGRRHYLLLQVTKAREHDVTGDQATRKILLIRNTLAACTNFGSIGIGYFVPRGSTFSDPLERGVSDPDNLTSFVRFRRVKISQRTNS